MTSIRTGICVILLLVSQVSAQEPPQTGVEPWQEIWDRFIDDYNACTQTPTCDFAKYADKVVTWKGVLEKVKPKTDEVAIRISLTPHTLLDKDGKPREQTVPPQPLKDIDLNCKSPEADVWQTVAAGTAVTFRGKTPSGGAIRFSNLGGQTLVLYYLIGCELVAKDGAS